MSVGGEAGSTNGSTPKYNVTGTVMVPARKVIVIEARRRRHWANIPTNSEKFGRSLRDHPTPNEESVNVGDVVDHENGETDREIRTVGPYEGFMVTNDCVTSWVPFIARFPRRALRRRVRAVLPILLLDILATGSAGNRDSHTRPLTGRGTGQAV